MNTNFIKDEFACFICINFIEVKCRHLINVSKKYHTTEGVFYISLTKTCLEVAFVYKYNAFYNNCLIFKTFSNFPLIILTH